MHVRLYAKGTALYTDAQVVNETHCELLPVIVRNAAPFGSMSVHPSMSEHVCVCVCVCVVPSRQAEETCSEMMTRRTAQTLTTAG